MDDDRNRSQSSTYTWIGVILHTVNIFGLLYNSAIKKLYILYIHGERLSHILIGTNVYIK